MNFEKQTPHHTTHTTTNTFELDFLRQMYFLHAVRTATVQGNAVVVAGDFNGACWRRKTGLEQQFDSSLEEAFKNAKLLVPSGFSPLWGLGGLPNELTDVCGFVKPHKSQTDWLIRRHGASENDREELGLC